MDVIKLCLYRDLDVSRMCDVHSESLVAYCLSDACLRKCAGALTGQMRLSMLENFIIVDGKANICTFDSLLLIGSF